MSSRELATKEVLVDLVNGYERRLSPAAQLTIATWACLKSLAMDADYTKSLAGLSSRDDRQTVRRDLRPPAHYVVSLAAFDQPNFAVRHVPLANFNRQWSAWLSTIVLGFAVVRVYGTTPTTSVTHSKSAGSHDRDAFTLWPPQAEATTWPPPAVMSVERLVPFFYDDMNYAAPTEHLGAIRDMQPMVGRCHQCGGRHRLQFELPLPEGRPCRLRHSAASLYPQTATTTVAGRSSTHLIPPA